MQSTLQRDPAWHSRVTATLLALLLLWPLLVWSEFKPWLLFDRQSLNATGRFLAGFFPPAHSTEFLWLVAEATWQTVAMATAGLVLALPAAGRFGLIARGATRTVLNISRAIPELVWASILLIAAGLGPFAGTLALALHTTGVLGRLFADALENSSPLPETALRINGVSPLAAFFYATLPQALPQMLSYTLYRWENNIRAAAILGVVGAGGLGQMLKYHLSLFQMQQAATVILVMFVLVAAVDAASFLLRRTMTR